MSDREVVTLQGLEQVVAQLKRIADASQGNAVILDALKRMEERIIAAISAPSNVEQIAGELAKRLDVKANELKTALDAAKES